MQRHRGQQRSHLPGIAFVHLPSVVKASLDQLLTNCVDDFVHHLTRGRLGVPLHPLTQTVQVAHLSRPNARAKNRRLRAPVTGHAKHMGRVAGRKSTVDGQPLALQPGQCAG